MNKIKIAILYPIWKLRTRKAKKMIKKSKNDPGRYTDQQKFNLALKQAERALKITKIKLTVHGYENLPKGVALLTPNHQSAVDGALIICALKKQTHEAEIQNKMAIFLAKEEMRKNKIATCWADLIDTVYFDRHNPKSALVAMDVIGKKAKEQRKYIVIFPEGTRTKDGKIQEFKPGSFRIAKKEFIPIVPVTINNSFSFSDSKRKEKLHVTVTFHQAIKPMAFMTQPTEFIAKKVQKIVEEGWKKPRERLDNKGVAKVDQV